MRNLFGAVQAKIRAGVQVRVRTGVRIAVLPVCIWVTFHAFEAAAQNRDWARPVNEKITLLATGLQGLAVGLAIVGLIIAAFGYVVQQRIDTTKVAAVLVGAAMATLGGTALQSFFG